MANLQSVLLPNLGLGNGLGQGARQAAMPTLTSASEFEYDSVGREEATGLELPSAIEGEAGAFSQLLKDSDGPNESKPVQIYQAQADPETIALRGGQAFELREFSGNQYPFWGNSLPNIDGVPETSITQDTGLLDPRPVLEIGLSQDSGVATEELGAFDSEEITGRSELVAELGAHDLASDDNRLLNVDTDVAPNGDSSSIETLFEIPFIDKAANSTKAPLDFSQVKNSLLSGGVEQKSLENQVALHHQEDQLELVSLQTKSGSDSVSLVTPSIGQTSASFEFFSKFMIEHTRQSRLENAAGVTRLDSPINYQELFLDRGEFDELLTSQNLRQASKGLPEIANAFTESPIGQSAGANTPLIASALSQWKADQEANPVTSASSVERQGVIKMSVPFSQSTWGENLGSRLSLLLAKNMDSAQIQLDPPELGPLGVKIQINQEQVSLQFTSAHSTVREALEQSAQKLQEMLKDEGLDLVDVDVSEERNFQGGNSNQHQSVPGDSGDLKGEENEPLENSDSLLTHSQKINVDDGKIDYFV